MRELDTMLRRAVLIAVSLSASAFALAGAPVLASDAEHALTREQVRALDRQIYGWRLMTRQERDEYRSRLGAWRTFEERERFVAEHQAAMQARARARGVALPDAPSATGGFGHGPGFGGGTAGGPGAGK